MIIGSHVKFRSEQLLGCVNEAISYNANAFMFYTGAPQNTIRASINPELTIKAFEKMKEHNLSIENVICHAPYIINLANNISLDKYEFSIDFLKKELNRCKELNVKYLVIHPGSAVTLDKMTAISNIINALNRVLTEDGPMILLETMAGKGTEIGSKISEIETIIKNISLKDKIGVCLDTCHLSDSGVDLKDFDTYLDLFDKYIGLDKIKCVHVNDSKNIISSNKDRHENFGYGHIGFEVLMSIINNQRLKNVPKILETPYYEDKPPYKEEIKMIRENRFNPNLYQDIINN